MNTQPARTRRYTVTLAHVRDHDEHTRREVSAASLTGLLRLLHADTGDDLRCPGCGSVGMSIHAIGVILEEQDLTRRLGEHAEELLAATA